MQSLWMILATLLFALMGVLAKSAAKYCAAAEIAFGRSLVSLVFMVFLVRIQGVSLRTPHWRWQASRGLVGLLAMMATFQAIVLLPLSMAISLQYTASMFLVLFLALTGLKFRFGIVLALLAGLAGVFLLLKPGLGGGFGLAGSLVGISAGALTGLAYFNVRELGALGEPELRTVFYFSVICTLGNGTWLILQGEHAWDIRGLLPVIGVGCLATAAQLAMTRAYMRGATFLVASLAYCTVIFSSLFGVLFFDDQIGVGGALGIGLIIVSGVAANHFSRASRSRKTTIMTD